MVFDLLKRLVAPAAEPLAGADARLAMASLMVRLARADGVYDMAEAAEITRLLAERYGLDRQSAEDLRAEAEAVEENAPDTVRFTRSIKEAVAYEDRIAVIEDLWAIVLSDGARDAEEDGLMRLAASLLGVNDRDSALARQRMEALRP